MEIIWSRNGREYSLRIGRVLSIDGDSWGVEVTEFAPGAVYTHTFTEPGEYAYYCSIHGTEQVGMVGTITVTA